MFSKEYLKADLLQGFYTVTESGSLEEGAKSCITLSGLGKLAPNMILMGFKAGHHIIHFWWLGCPLF
jgi:hypothetical protein